MRRALVIGFGITMTLLWIVSSGCRDRAGEMPRFLEVTDFNLSDSFERAVTRADLTGRVSIVSFFLSSCAASSIGVSSRMAELQQKTAALPGVQLISLTVDPQADRPATLRQYATQYGAHSNRWRFVTGPKSDVQGLIMRCFLSDKAAEKAKRDHSDPLLEQCDHIAIVDQQGWVRGWFDGTRFGTVPRVMDAVNQLYTNSVPNP